MSGGNAWLLIVDTKGVNVWCAAGKGTFGTAEVVRRINEFEIGKIVVHKKLMLPQLSATGVQAHKVTKATGFKIVYGHVDSKDLLEFVALIECFERPGRDLRVGEMTENQKSLYRRMGVNPPS